MEQDNEQGDLQPLIDYLRKHWDTYGVEALRAQLLAQGHGPEDVESAISHVYAEREQADAPNVRGLRRSVIAANVVVALITSLLAFWAVILDLPNPWWLLIFAPLLELGIGALFIDRGRVQLGRTLVVSALYSLAPMAGYATLVGVCVSSIRP